MSTTVHPPEIAPATKIWDINTDWSLYSQCCIWDSARGCVHIWECIRPHISTPTTRVCFHFRYLIMNTDLFDSQPPNSIYWRYLGRR
ncbi:hypothetical protein J3A83DRAFT_1118143 [Scleroderma citrinum]